MYERKDSIPRGKRVVVHVSVEFCRNESRARFARDSEKRHTENKWNCIHGASEGLLRKMNHKWSGKLARTCNRSKEPPDSIASPDRLTMEFLYGRCVLPFCLFVPRLVAFADCIPNFLFFASFSLVSNNLAKNADRCPEENKYSNISMTKYLFDF